MKKLYLGLVGKPGSGKETIVHIVKSLFPAISIGHHHFSDPLYEIIGLLPPLEKNRESAQKLAVGLKNEFGGDVLTNAVKQRILGDANTIVILDGIRWLPDEKMLRELPNNILLYVFADPEKRYERLKQRKQKVGEEFTSWERFLEEDDAENERYIEEIGKRADYSPLNNNGNTAYLSEQINDLFTTEIYAEKLHEAGK